jgi:hypothetical protein
VSDHLTAEEEKRLRAFTRGRWILFWLLVAFSPLILALTAVIGWPQTWDFWSMVFALVAATVPLLLYLSAKFLWTEARMFRDRRALPLSRVRGTFRIERTRGYRGATSVVYFIGSTPVAFATQDLRKKLVEEKPCVVRMLGAGPWVVVDVLHAEK